MRISVIVTTYNRPDALQKVLDGISGQTLLPEEVLVADDGSGRETENLIAAAAGNLPCPLHHVWQEDRGFRAARIRNLAVRKSVGDYLILLDGDTIPEPHFVEDHRSLARPGAFFQGKRILLSRKLTDRFSGEDAGRGKFRLFFSRDIGNRHHLIRLPFFPLMKSGRLSGIRSCNMSFFRKDIEAVNGFNEDFTGWGREDSELAARFFVRGLRKTAHPFMAVCFHLWHEENDRNRLAINDEILRITIASGQYECINGLRRR